MLRAPVLMAAIILAGCSGTQMTVSGSACGQPFEAALNDRRDREGVELVITCPDGGSMTYRSGASNPSAVDADALARILSTVLE